MSENEIKRFCIMTASNILAKKKNLTAKDVLRQARKLYAWFKEKEGNQ